ncbi:uncharacterized protein L201_005662 [Kwoniella dendrophila CBS 6074]|uniref:Major facilitator superfamily (MFS) profile domain-containing protein n=1 Tax=Kwoniella dendrophila CBS 6074 TaxID=1295534 RepID=A0AAX4K1S9_9TREE
MAERQALISTDSTTSISRGGGQRQYGGTGRSRRGLNRMTTQEIKIKIRKMADLVSSEELGNREFTDLSLYEKKSLLINRELDEMGMGKYQWCVFTLCGLGYFLDLGWAQAFGLVGSAIQQELGVPDSQIGALSTAFNFGLCIGAFGWGMLVDIVGRRWCFNFTCLFSTIFGLCFALPSNYVLTCILACLIGLGVGGNIPVDATITLEFLPTKNRYLLAALSTFQPIGTVAVSLLAFALIPKYSCDTSLKSCNISEAPCCSRSNNMGWRYTIMILGFFTLLIFFLRFAVFKFRESPKYLLSKGHDAHALDILHSISKFNKTKSPTLTIEDFRALDYEEARRTGQDDPHSRSTTQNSTLQRSTSTADIAKRVTLGGLQKTFGHLAGMFKQKIYLWLFISLSIAYMALFWSFALAGYFLPLILKAKGIDADGSLADTYRSYLYIYTPGITATLTAAWITGFSKFGRRWIMVISSALMGASLALYQLVDSRAANIGFNAMEYWFQSIYAALLYAYTPEAFPATFRGSTSGMLSTLGRIASIIAPIVGGSVYHGSDSPGVLWLAAGGAWISTLAIAFLPYDTNRKENA